MSSEHDKLNYDAKEFMIATCESCGRDFLTEADPHVVRPTPQGYKLYCYCQIKGFEEVKPGLESIYSLKKPNPEALDEVIEMLNSRRKTEPSNEFIESLRLPKATPEELEGLPEDAMEDRVEAKVKVVAAKFKANRK